LIALTGCRRREIESLLWQEVDKTGRCLRLDDSKTGKSLRPIGLEVIKILGAIRAHDRSCVHVLPAVRGVEGPYQGLPKA
jgi:integrase